MTAATKAVLIDPAKPIRFPQLILTSGEKVEQGWAGAMNLTTGKVVQLTAARALLPNTYRYLGKFPNAYDASATAPGGAADTPCLVDLGYERFCTSFRNDTVNAVLQAGIGSQCYFLDNQTVCSTNTSMPAGTAWEFDANGNVLVEVCPVVTTATANQIQSVLDTTSANFTGNDWAPTGAALTAATGTTYVIGSTSNLGANATLTLPSAGVTAGTTVKFMATGGQGAFTVTLRMGVTAITSALTASKRWVATAVNVGDATTSIWVVDYTVDA